MDKNLKIISADYCGKDVTKIVQSQLINNIVTFKVSNGLFGDPKPNIVKYLTVKYEHDNSINETTVRENNILILPEQPKNEKLGIFYTNNHVPDQFLAESLFSIQKAAKKNNVTVLTSSWEKIKDNPFSNILSNYRISCTFNIAYQITSLLKMAKNIHDFKYVSFLEHDVLYPEDYFDYKPFDNNVICNVNYKGICKNGFQSSCESQQPLHQMTMNFEFALQHFKEIMYLSIDDGICLEPDYGRDTWHSENPSLHINHGRNFTSHFATYKKDYHKSDKYWGEKDDFKFSL